MKHLILTLLALLCATPCFATKDIPGYDFGAPHLKNAPYSLKDLELLKTTLLFTKEDEQKLQDSLKILAPHAEEILDTWYGFVGGTPHLLYYFQQKNGEPDGEYLARVRKRFKQWIFDTAKADYDQEWLNYQYEIGKRHHKRGKNKTDGASGPKHIPMRYVIALTYPVTATLKPFLQRGNASEAEVDAMHQAWIKAVLLQTILWSEPYARKNQF